MTEGVVPTTANRIYIETYGCQMNEYDTELVRSILTQHHYQIVTHEREANVVLLNTCSVRENANNKIYGRIHEIRHRRPDRVWIGILGCMATNFKQQLLENPNLGIDLIAGPDSYKELPQLIREAAETGAKSFDVTLSEFETYSDILPTRREGVNAWIAVMRGCNNFCTFCVVPYTRGRERSRDPHNVVAEVKALVADGFTQVTLLGQNVNSYRHDGCDFADLMNMVSDVPGIRRIRYTSPHPKDFPEKFLAVMAERDNICKQIHMPLQAGADRVLKAMNRTYTNAEFRDLVAKARTMVPGVSLSTDIIVGFPSESPDEFEETVKVVEDVRFDTAFIFKYSERPLTYASRRLPDDVPEDEKTRRIMKLNDIQRSITTQQNRALIGTTEEVLIERESTRKNPDDFQGRTEANRIVILPKGPYKMGDYVPVRFTDATSQVLKGYVTD